MKKLIMAITPLFLASCAALKDAGHVVEDAVNTPPNYVLDALKALLSFIEGTLGAAVSLFLHNVLPF